SNLGTGASVSLAAATDLLRLAGYSGVFANQVSGAGQLVLDDKAGVTLNGTQKVADSIGVDIGTDSNLTLSSLTAFNHALTGDGTLNISTGNQTFAFGTNTGSGYKGTVNLGDSQFALAGNNTTALTQANLSVNKGAKVSVTGGEQAIGGLVLNGGTTLFNEGVIKTGKLSVTGTDASIIQVEPGQTLTGDNLLDQNVKSTQTLVDSDVVLTADELANLTLQGSQGQALDTGTEQAIIQNSVNVGTGTYNYTLSGEGGGLSTVAQLVKVALAAGKMLALDTTDSVARTFTAQITGSGDLALNAHSDTLTLNSADNDYTGGTTINSGTVVAGSNNALGATSSLSTVKDTQFNLNGKTQTINGTLTNAGTVSLGGGTLTLNNGGTSTSEGGLTGSGTLQVNGGNLILSEANNDLAGSTIIGTDGAVTLNDSGDLGSAAVTVGGNLNLNADQSLANVLSGVGSINTTGQVTLSGDNGQFTGTHNLNGSGSLTVSKASSLGGNSAKVAINSNKAALILNALTGTLNSVLSGVADSQVQVTNKSAVTLNASNTNFLGQYAISGGSSMQIGDAANLGSKASVSLATAADILALAGLNGALANTVTGLGQLVLNSGSKATLSGNNIADTVGVDIDTDSNLILSSLTAFNHALTGGGILSIDAGNQAFTFGANTGSGYKGTVDLANSQFALSGNNTTALTQASLAVSQGAKVNVTDGAQAIGGLALNGGTTTFNDGSITTDNLSVSGDATSIIQVQPGQTQTGSNLLDQNVGSRQQLVNSTVQLTDKDLEQLVLQDSKGQVLGDDTELAIDQGGIDVATGTYNYGLSGVGGGLSTVARLIKVALAADHILTLDTKESSAKTFTAQITGSGNLALNASGETLTLNNAGNDYTGGTTINSGTVVAGSNNALGATSGLTTLAGSGFNLNGKNQTINGALTNAGTVTVGENGTLTSSSLNNSGTVALAKGA
ncbi:autotransporter-associated beta strand repeat-containing protein, partial [Citrobacter sp. JGM124]|uniref:autotransporter-associated beta strand repeat-containing protein n=1 Tax=Citrobacter sp. JGM124 TaxID=2799789 RepID=UPI001BC3EB8C